MKYQSQSTESKAMHKCGIINALNLMLALLIFTGCSKFHRHQTIHEPVSVTIVDESRIDNLKIRHVFKEFLLKEIINKGKGWVNAFDTDTFSTQYADYQISFDIMDYSSTDIERGVEKLLVSTKIVKTSNRSIVNSYIESAAAKDIDQVCQKTAEKLSAALTDRLLALHRYQVPETSTMPADTLK